MKIWKIENSDTFLDDRRDLFHILTNEQKVCATEAKMSKTEADVSDLLGSKSQLVDPDGGGGLEGGIGDFTVGDVDVSCPPC